MKTLLVIGDDRIGQTLLSRLPARAAIGVVIDRSSNWRRVLGLVLKRTVSPIAVWLMWLAEAQRKEARAGHFPSIRSNQELLQVVRETGVGRVILFRAGLIVNRALLSAGAEILNVHCARLPDFGGLAAIYRALQRGDLLQCATLHRVTERIDAGEIIATLPYTLDPARSYFHNEQLAYEAGMALLMDYLNASQQVRDRSATVG